jgi:hypothetical protein
MRVLPPKIIPKLMLELGANQPRDTAKNALAELADILPLSKLINKFIYLQI